MMERRRRGPRLTAAMLQTHLAGQQRLDLRQLDILQLVHRPGRHWKLWKEETKPSSEEPLDSTVTQALLQRCCSCRETKMLHLSSGFMFPAVLSQTKAPKVISFNIVQVSRINPGCTMGCFIVLSSVLQRELQYRQSAPPGGRFSCIFSKINVLANICFKFASTCFHAYMCRVIV